MDPVEQTVLANEQVVNGKGWRSGAVVERKKLSQWFFDITRFSDDLLKGLEKLDGWPEKVKTMQKNWIGKSTGCEIRFSISSENSSINVFTTRPDTIFGASFIALSVDHPLCKKFLQDPDFKKSSKKIVLKLVQQKKLWLMLIKMVTIQIYLHLIHSSKIKSYRFIS